MNSKEEKRIKILEAAGECFRQFGYKKTTLDDIGRLVGLNKASLYYYFKNKEEIFINLKTSQYNELIIKLNEIMNEQQPCKQKILQYFKQRHEWWYQESSIVPQITKEDIHTFISIGDVEVARIREQEKANFARAIAVCRTQGEFKPCNEQDITKYIFALVDGIMTTYRQVDTMRPVTDEESENILKDTQSALKIFIDGLSN
ncbi:MAG: TetR/AcrR family transcriptional regulator [Candidatus Thorarchaeota archaeon]